MTEALVTGGAGFIGSNLVEAIINKYQVAVLDNFHTGSISNLEHVSKDINLITGSCNDCLALNLSPDVIFHLGIPSSSPMYRKNPFLVGEAINGAVAIMELARQKGSKKVVFASSSSVYNGVPTPHREDAIIPVKDYYTEARMAIERVAELYFQLYGIDYAGLRFFSVYGPHEKAKGPYANVITQFIWGMKAGEPPVIFGDGSQTRDFIFVKDVVDALLLTSKKGTGIFNVGTGKAYSFNHVVDIINSRIGTDLRPVYKENPIKNYVMHTLADTSKIESMGFSPRYTLEEGLRIIMA
jgi:UDP-glucose 4-epimerase